MVDRASTASRAESKLTLDERCPVPFRPRKKKNRQAKYHRCSRCGSQVRKRTVRCKRCASHRRSELLSAGIVTALTFGRVSGSVGHRASSPLEKPRTAAFRVDKRRGSWPGEPGLNRAAAFQQGSRFDWIG